MEIVTTKECDVTGVVGNHVELFRIAIYKSQPPDEKGNNEVEVESHPVYLSPRALKRCKHFINRGCTPAPPRKTTKTPTPEPTSDSSRS